MIVVLGAGPAGLVAAWRAARAGHEVTVVEQSPFVGGMAASFDVGGVRVDHGSHRLHPSTEPAILADLFALLGRDLQLRPRHGRIRLDERWVAFPLRTTDLVRRLPARFAMGAARDAIGSPFRRARTDTFAEVVRAGLGRTVADGFYRPYAQKLWGTDAGELAGELARRRVSAASPVDIVRRLARGARPEGRRFYYPRRGFGAISEALATAAVDAGVAIELGVSATRADLADDRVLISLSNGRVIDGARVWSTIPLPALARLTSPRPSAAVLARAAGLRHRAMVLVYLVLDQPQYTPFDAHYFPAPDVAVARLSEPKNYRASADDPADRTVLCAEVPCWEDDDTWTADENALGDLVAESLVRSGLPSPEPAHVEARRLPRVYPLYRVGFAWDVAALEQWADAQPRLLTFGRQGMFVPDNSHHALVMGWAAAAALRHDGSFDQSEWRRARDGFRAHVVED